MKINNAISEEKTQDLINIHNFLTAVSVDDEGNISAFTLGLLIHSELQGREEAKPYLDEMAKLLSAPTH